MDKSKTIEKTEIQTAWREDIEGRLSMSLERPLQDVARESQIGSFCPNCGATLEGRKCKLFCPTPGCGYLVTCSEW